MMATARQGKFLVALMAFCRVRVLFPSYAVFVGLVSGFFRRRHVRLVGGQARAEAGSGSGFFFVVDFFQDLEGTRGGVVTFRRR